jgi:transcriptional regulator with XRE-family HTH domain
MRLRTYMREKSLTPIDVATLYDCSSVYIYKILRERIVGPKVLKRLSKALGIEITEI